MMRVISVISTLFLLSSVINSAEPVLRQIIPRGGQRGTEVSVRLHGERLKDAESLLYYTSGIETVELNVVDAKKIDAKLKIAADCRLGEHSLRVRTRSGLSSFFTFWVGPYPSVEEKEPNSLFEEAQPISIGVTVVGAAIGVMYVEPSASGFLMRLATRRGQCLGLDGSSHPPQCRLRFRARPAQVHRPIS